MPPKVRQDLVPEVTTKGHVLNLAFTYRQVLGLFLAMIVGLVSALVVILIPMWVRVHDHSAELPEIETHLKATDSQVSAMYPRLRAVELRLHLEPSSR